MLERFEKISVIISAWHIEATSRWTTSGLAIFITLMRAVIFDGWVVDVVY